MERWNRRQFLSAAGVTALGLAAGACGQADQGAESNSTGTLRWWDHYNALQELHKQMLSEFSASSEGVPTEYTFYQVAQFAEALQLAKQSDQQPDVHSLVQIDVPLPGLVESGWFQPLALPDDAMGRFAENDLVEGIHRFGGELYSFPIFSFRWHHALLWYHSDMLETMGVEPPTTFDEFRDACRQAKKVGDNVAGWVGGFKDNNSYFHVPNVLAQAAGFPGQEGLEYHTGEIRYEHDAYLQVFELFDSLRKDGLLFPAANSATNLEARGRWAAGEGVFIFDGPWQVGSVKRDFPDALDGMDTGGLITGAAGMAQHVYRKHRPGAFYIAQSSELAEAANELLGMLTTPEYYMSLASAMDQPPRDLQSVADSQDAHPVYKKAIANFAEHVFLGPSAEVGNSDVTMVAAETKPVSMNLDAIFAGFISGDITDYRQALTDLSSELMTERDRAIEAAKAKGAEVSVDDYVFANWRPDEDYTADMYS